MVTIQYNLIHNPSLPVPFSAWLSLEERARRLATAELGATGATGDVGRLADPGRYSELWFISMSPSRQHTCKGESPFDFNFLCVCFNYDGSLHVVGSMCYRIKTPTSSSVINMENSHGNIVVNKLQQLTSLWGGVFFFICICNKGMMMKRKEGHNLEIRGNSLNSIGCPPLQIQMSAFQI